MHPFKPLKRKIVFTKLSSRIHVNELTGASYSKFHVLEVITCKEVLESVKHFNISLLLKSHTSEI